MSAQASGSTLSEGTVPQAMSLHQQCMSLRARLLRIRGFQTYFSTLHGAGVGHESFDPVPDLQDLLCLGVSLCYLFDQLPDAFPKINNSEFDQIQYHENPDREKKRAIALFALQVRNPELIARIPGLEPFSISDLWDRSAPVDGFLKVVKSVSAIVDVLTQGVFEEPLHTPPQDAPSVSVQTNSAVPGPPQASMTPGPPEMSSNTQETRRVLIIREIVDTERNFVERLEFMKTYATELVRQNIMDQDTVDQMFPNLDNIVDFHRQFLAQLETTREQAWSEQCWGQHFVDCEDQLVTVYEPYSLQFATVSELLQSRQDDLVFKQLNALNNVNDLRAYQSQPVSRVCKYPLVLEELLKVATADDLYPHLEVMKLGLEASRRIFTKITETMDRGDRVRTFDSLMRRVADWKGHQVRNFGQLLLHETLRVTKSDIEREFYVCLFENVVICCKEVAPGPPSPPRLGRGRQDIGSRNTALLLKGRIFVSNLVEVIPQQATPLGAPGIPQIFPLKVWWRGETDLESFVLHFMRRDQMRQWGGEINRLIRDEAQRSSSPGAARLDPGPNETLPHGNRPCTWENTLD